MWHQINLTMQLKILKIWQMFNQVNLINEQR